MSKQWAPWSGAKFVVHDYGLYCLSVSHKNDARFIWVNDICLYLNNVRRSKMFCQRGP